MARVFWDFSMAARAGAYSRGRRPRSTTPYDVSRSARSRASRSPVIRSASSWVVSWRLVAAFMQAPRLVEPGRPGDHLVPAVAGALVAGQRAGPADVALAGARAVRRERGVDAGAADQEVGHLGGGRRGERDQPAPRPDGRQEVLDRRRAEHPDGAVGRLLDRLEQRVGRLVGEPVGVLDDHDLPPPPDRRQRGAAYQVADLVDADRQLLGAHDGDVGMAPGQRPCGRSGRRRSRAAAPRTAARRRTRSPRWSGPTPAAR